MPILHIDGHSGVTGQRLVGALVALGLRPSAIEWELGLIAVGDFHLHLDRVGDGVHFSIHEGATHRHDQDEDHGHHHGHDHSHGDDCCQQGDEHAHHHHAHEGEHSHHEGGCCHHHHPEAVVRTAAQVRELVTQSQLSPKVIEVVLKVLDRLAAAEGERRFTADETLQRLATLIAVATGLDALKVSTVTASTLHESRHEADPAVLTLLAGLPLARDVDGHAQIDVEGAAIVAAITDTFTDAPSLSNASLGIGVGKGCGCGHPPSLTHLLLGEK